jgi:uncharacterized membrane protein YhaH (DUF805 family)
MNAVGWFLSFRGRLSRSGYWKRIGTIVVLFFFFGPIVDLPGFPLFLFLGVRLSNGDNWPGDDHHRWLGHSQFLPSVAVAALLWALLFSAVVRRLHDMDRRGWWSLLAIGTAGLGLGWVGAIEGNEEENRFGPVP